MVDGPLIEIDPRVRVNIPAFEIDLSATYSNESGAALDFNSRVTNNSNGIINIDKENIQSIFNMGFV